MRSTPAGGAAHAAAAATPEAAAADRAAPLLVKDDTAAKSHRRARREEASAGGARPPRPNAPSAPSASSASGAPAAQSSSPRLLPTPAELDATVFDRVRLRAGTSVIMAMPGALEQPWMAASYTGVVAKVVVVAIAESRLGQQHAGAGAQTRPLRAWLRTVAGGRSRAG